MTVLRRFLRDRRRAYLWWSLGMAAMVGLTVAFYPSIRGEASFEELMEDLPEAVRALVGAETGIAFTSPAGYLHSRMFASLVPILLLIFGIGLGARAIGGSEDDGTLEFLLANPVTRRRVALERAVGVVVLVLALTAFGAVALFALGPTVDVLDGISAGRIGAAWSASAALAMVHAALAFAVGAATGRRAPALATATVVAVGGYLLEGLLAVTDTLGPLRVVSPWHWYLERNTLADGPTATGVVAPVAVTVVLALVSAWRFERRDLS